MKKYLWMVLATIIMLTPFLTTGCGSDDTEADTKLGVYTIGPGNMEKFDPSLKAN